MTPTVDDFLASYPTEVRDIAVKLRALVREVLPNALEIVDVPAKMIAYGTENTYKGMICVISPFAKHVNLGFARGTSVPDPAGLLEGTGKRARHVKLKSVEDVERPEIRALLEAAVDEHRAHVG